MPFNLPDRDVFITDANASPPGVRTVLFNMAIGFLYRRVDGIGADECRTVEATMGRIIAILLACWTMLGARESVAEPGYYAFGNATNKEQALVETRCTRGGTYPVHWVPYGPVDWGPNFRTLCMSVGKVCSSVCDKNADERGCEDDPPAGMNGGDGTRIALCVDGDDPGGPAPIPNIRARVASTCTAACGDWWDDDTDKCRVICPDPDVATCDGCRCSGGIDLGFTCLWGDQKAHCRCKSPREP